MADNIDSSRRKLITGIAGAGIMLNLGASRTAHAVPGQPPERLPICYFSKHLQWLNWEEMAEAAAELGFAGIDLTVRKGGHVEPERAKEDLPKVVKIVRRAGLDVPMITAGIVDVDSPHAESIIQTASELGIRRYRWGWFFWSDNTGNPDVTNYSRSISSRFEGVPDIPNRLAQLKKRVGVLAEMNRKYGVCAMYHNHSGPMVGASVWDLWILLRDFDPEWVSSNFDVGHATVEGGVGGWVNSTRLMMPFMKGTAIKDFKWGRSARGRWEPLWCPLGGGMVNFPAYLTLLKEGQFSGPIQLHTEYPLGGIENGARKLTMGKSVVLTAIRKDLDTLKGWIREARLS